MSFRKYMHLERFGNAPVEGIELGMVFLFPKLDGTNASTWMGHDGGEFLCSGSRTRELSTEQDNAGFHTWVTDPKAKHNLFLFHNKYWNLRLYGEWLVPHTFKGYREEAWRKFYVFDVFNDETQQYLSYEAYKPLLDEFGVEYIPPLCTMKNGSYEDFLKVLEKNLYLIPDGGEPGEGIVIKNYDYYNRFGEQVWAKIVRNEFKEANHKAFGAPSIHNGLMNEEKILDKALTHALIDKTIAKIVNSGGLDIGWNSGDIPELFGRLYYDIIKEELFDSLKEIQFGSVNFKTLKAVMINRVKQMKPELFA